MGDPTGGRRLLRAVKDTARAGRPALGLGIDQPLRGLLRPVATDRAHQDRADVQRLTDWRNRYSGAFLTEFEATPDRTAGWLADVVGADDTRILFMIDTVAGDTIGYIGLGYIDWDRSYGEADSVVRGLPAEKGMMSLAMGTLLGWGQRMLGLGSIGVRVLSDNPALEFYRRSGFVEQKRVPLRVTPTADGVAWQEAPDHPNPERELVHFMYRGTEDAT